MGAEVVGEKVTAHSVLAQLDHHAILKPIFIHLHCSLALGSSDVKFSFDFILVCLETRSVCNPLFAFSSAIIYSFFLLLSLGSYCPGNPYLEEMHTRSRWAAIVAIQSCYSPSHDLREKGEDSEMSPR